MQLLRITLSDSLCDCTIIYEYVSLYTVVLVWFKLYLIYNVEKAIFEVSSTLLLCVDIEFSPGFPKAYPTLMTPPPIYLCPWLREIQF